MPSGSAEFSDPELQLLRADHAGALLAFERENRAYFAASISDRGDDYFANFDARHAALLAEQAERTCLFHLLVDPSGQILGRFNLVDIADGSAELGYRLAEKATGKGLATRSVRQICGLAVGEYRLKKLHARTTLDNVRSQAVLVRTGFIVIGETEIGGSPALRYERDLGATEGLRVATFQG